MISDTIGHITNDTIGDALLVYLTVIETINVLILHHLKAMVWLSDIWNKADAEDSRIIRKICLGEPWN